jgi:nucleoside-diphosphate-sugar epimerase
MSRERLFVFGFGYSARAVAARMRPKVKEIVGTTRDPEKVDEIAALGVVPLLFDGDAPTVADPLRRALSNADVVLVSIAPGERGDPVLRHFRSELAAAIPKSVVYLSTVGVYGDHDGAWVDETSERRPVSKRSKERVAAEDAWGAFSDKTGVPVAIIRLAGIYGPGRGPFEKIRRGTAQRIVKPGQVFNRIHVNDIAQIVEAALERRANGIFNGTDDEPAPPQDVLAYAAELLHLPLPREVAYEDANLTPMARSFYGESKRVRNDKIKHEFGVRLAYPTYREGLKAILAAEAFDASDRKGIRQ